MSTSHEISVMADAISEALDRFRREEETVGVFPDLGYALAGFIMSGDRLVAVYDTATIAEHLMEHYGLDEDEAWEHIEFNIAGARYGPHTPRLLAPPGFGS